MEIVSEKGRECKSNKCEALLNVFIIVYIICEIVYTVTLKGYTNMNTSTLSEKGWVVIPQHLRKRYGLKKGDRVHIIDYGGVISIVPASESPVKASLGLLKVRLPWSESY